MFLVYVDVAHLLNIERLRDKFAMICAAETGRVDRRAFSAAACHHCVLTHILERLAEFRTWERHQMKMTVLAVLYSANQGKTNNNNC